jgi:hypothetical protein
MSNETGSDLRLSQGLLIEMRDYAVRVDRRAAELDRELTGLAVRERAVRAELTRLQALNAEYERLQTQIADVRARRDEAVSDAAGLRRIVERSGIELPPVAPGWWAPPGKGDAPFRGDRPVIVDAGSNCVECETTGYNCRAHRVRGDHEGAQSDAG